MVMAKGIASGLPLSAIAASQALMSQWIAGTHGGTYTANAIACAAAVATIQAMREERMVDNAAHMGELLRDGLTELQSRHPAIGQVRGLGLMIAAEFGSPRLPDTKLSKAVLHRAGADGLMLLTCGPLDNVIRFVPPLVVNESQIEEGLRILEKALQAA